MLNEANMPGLLKTVSLSEKQEDLLFEYISHNIGNSDIAFLHNLVGKEMAIEFLDIFAGCRLRIPKRSDIIKAIVEIKIYEYVNSRGGTDEAIEKCGRVFKKRPEVIHRILNKVEETLSKEID